MNDVTSYGGTPQNFDQINKKRNDDKEQLELQSNFNPKSVKGLGEEDSTLTSLSTNQQVIKEEYLATSSRLALPTPSKDQVPFDKEVIGSEFLKKFTSLKDTKPSAPMADPIFEEQLSLYSQQKNLNQEEVAKLRFAFYHPEAVEDPQLKEDAKALTGSTEKQLQKQLNLPPDPIKPNPEVFDSLLQEAYANAFEDQLGGLAKKMNLTKEQVNQIRFAHYNPGKADPATQKLLTTVENAALALLQKQLGLPPGWKPSVNTAEFTANMEVTYDQAFENTLDNQVPPLTEAQKGLLRFMHNNPGVKFPGSAEMEAMLHAMELSTLNALKSSLGLPQGFQIAPATQFYNSMLSGAFQAALSDQLSEYLDTIKPPMTKKDQELLEKALENPDDPSIPPEIKAIAAKLQGKAITAVKGKYNLPDVWTPESLAMKPIPVNPGTTLVKNGLAELEEFIKTSNQTLLKLPGGPEKSALIDFLKQISDALGELKMMLYSMQTNDTLTAKKITEVKLSDQKEKIKNFQESQRVAQEKAKESGGKGGGKSQSTQKFMSIFMKVITPMLMLVTFVITAVIVITTGGTASIAAVALCIIIMGSLTALMIADSQTQCISKVFQLVSDVLEMMMPDWVPGPVRDLTDILVKVVIILAVLLVCCVSPTALLSVGIGFAMQAVMDSGIVQKGIGVCGGDAKAQAIAAMVIGVVLALAVAFISIFSGFLSGGGGVGGAGVNAVVGAIKGSAMAAKTAAAMAKAAAALGKVGAAVGKTVDATVKAAKNLRFIQVMTKIFAKVVATKKQAIQYIQKIAKNVQDDYEFIEKLSKWVKEGIEKATKAMQNYSQYATGAVSQASLALNATADVIQIKTQIEAAEMHFDLAALAIMAGELEAAMKEIEALIKSLTKLIAVFMDGLADFGKWITSVNDLQAKNWKDAGNQMTRLVQSTPA